VLSYLALSKSTLPGVLKRVRDVSAGVRKAAFEILVEKVDPRSLKIAQRVALAQSGLKDRYDAISACTMLEPLGSNNLLHGDRTPQVQQMCSKLLCESWLHRSNDDILQVCNLRLWPASAPPQAGCAVCSCWNGSTWRPTPRSVVSSWNMS